MRNTYLVCSLIEGMYGLDTAEKQSAFWAEKEARIEAENKLIKESVNEYSKTH
jgi:hypothetical protein